MSSLGFRTALSGLTTATSALSVIGHNLANAGTDGYSRQRVGLDALSPQITAKRYQIGRGVEIERVDRIANSLLNDRLRLQRGEIGRYDTLSGYYSELQTLFGEPGGNGLGGDLNSLMAELSALTSAPEEPALRINVLAGAQNLAQSFNTLTRQLHDLGRDIGSAVRAEVDQINSLTEELGELNNTILRAGLGPNVPPDLVDRQERLLTALGNHLDVRVHREQDGRVTVYSSNTVLVSPNGNLNLEVSNLDPITGQVEVRGFRSTAVLEPNSGSLRALLDLSSQGVDDRTVAIDKLAEEFIRQFNRVHSTGIPSGGGHRSLSSSNFFDDANNSGSVLDDTLSAAGLPFEIVDGQLTVNVTNIDTGEVQQNRIAINPNTMTVQDLLNELSGIDGLTASVDPGGQLRIAALGSHRFDFSNRVPPVGDLGNTFGSNRASIVSSNSETFALTSGAQFTVDVDNSGPTTITLNGANFADISQATPEELVAEINSQLSGATAEVQNGRVVIRSNTAGAAGSLQLADGTGNPLAAIGLSTALETGSDVATEVGFEGTYSGDSDSELTFVPRSAGTIGETGGLVIDVFDSTGSAVTSLNVGSDYTPGESIEVIDGISVSFSGGYIDPASGEQFSAAFVAAGDSSDVLVAMGLGGFFTGSDAASIGIDPDVLAEPDLFAAGLTGAVGDNGNLLKLQRALEAPISGLDDDSTIDFYRNVISQLGSEAARVDQTLDSQGLVMEALEAQRDAVSGVNVDEELLNLEEFQRLYQASARFLQTIQEVTDILLNL